MSSVVEPNQNPLNSMYGVKDHSLKTEKNQETIIYTTLKVYFQNKVSEHIPFQHTELC